MRRAAALVPLALAAAACAGPSAWLSAEGREQVVRELARQPRHLRVAVHVAPFYGDGSRVLFTDRPTAEVLGPGEALPPPAPFRVLAPGTPVFVDGVEFPTGAILWTRPSDTPRLRPWLLATLEGVDRPAVLVLSARTPDPDDVVAEAGRVLSTDDLTPAFQALPAPQRAAILRKTPIEGMGRQAVAMAWGQPDVVEVDPRARTEDWTWAGGRRARFQDDRLLRFGPGAPAGPAPSGPAPR
jgi:hypothetical protein